MTAWFQKDPRFLAAWQKAVFPDGPKGGARSTYLRGRNGWNIINQYWNDPGLDLTHATMDSDLTGKLLEVFDSNQGTFNLADAFICIGVGFMVIEMIRDTIRERKEKAEGKSGEAAESVS